MYRLGRQASVLPGVPRRGGDTRQLITLRFAGDTFVLGGLHCTVSASFWVRAPCLNSLIGEWRGLFPLRISRSDFQCGFHLALPSLPRQQLAYERFFLK